MAYCGNDLCDRVEPCPLHGGGKVKVDFESEMKMTDHNRQAWDVLADTHFKTYHIDKLLSGTSLLSEELTRGVGDVRGKTLVHLLCHIGTDTLSWALLGAKVTGVDISSVALTYARQLAARMKIEANFVQTDIMRAREVVNDKFDIVFSSTGVMCWLPSIKVYAETVRHLLKPGGVFYLHDGHPFRNMFDDDDVSKGVSIDYFQKEPRNYPDMGDYTDPTLSIPVPAHEWDWTLGEIVTAFCEVGLRIVSLREFPQFFYAGYSAIDVVDDKVELFPCTFSLKATLA